MHCEVYINKALHYQAPVFHKKAWQLLCYRFPDQWNQWFWQF
jgi:hypothetical protein